MPAASDSPAALVQTETARSTACRLLANLASSLASSFLVVEMKLRVAVWILAESFWEMHLSNAESVACTMLASPRLNLWAACAADADWEMRESKTRSAALAVLAAKTDAELAADKSAALAVGDKKSLGAAAALASEQERRAKPELDKADEGRAALMKAVQARAAELRKAKTVIADGLLHAMLGAGKA